MTKVKGTGFNPYRKADGTFCSAEEAGANFENKITELRAAGEDTVADKLEKEYNSFVMEKLPSSDKAQKLFKNKYGMTNSVIKKEKPSVKNQIETFSPAKTRSDSVLDSRGFALLNKHTEDQLNRKNSDVDPELMKTILKKRGEVTQRLAEETNTAWENFREAESFTDEKEAAMKDAIRKSEAMKSYRHRTANFLEKMDNSFQYSKLDQWEHENLGNAVKTTSYEPSSREWLEERLDSVGGSDVGVLAVEHLVPKDEKAPYHAKSLAGIKRSKLKVDEENVKKQTIGSAPASPEDAKTIGYNPHAEPTPLYFGNASESYIAKSFEEDRGDKYKLYEAKDQFVNKDRAYQKVNVDGVLVDKETGETGILEIKNVGAKPDPPEKDESGWSDADNDLSPNYRAQVLYYLNATGYKFGAVRIRYNDNEFRDFYIDADDDVVAGSGVKMSDFVNDYVEPFYKKAKRTREASIGITAESIHTFTLS